MNLLVLIVRHGIVMIIFPAENLDGTCEFSSLEDCESTCTYSPTWNCNDNFSCTKIEMELVNFHLLKIVNLTVYFKKHGNVSMKYVLKF